MHRAEPVAEALETARRARDGLGVAVDADDARGRDLLQDRLGVPAHPERAVHEDGAGLRQRRSEEVDAPLEEDRDVPLGGVVGSARHVRLLSVLVGGRVARDAPPGGAPRRPGPVRSGLLRVLSGAGEVRQTGREEASPCGSRG